jgi:hypothetical protein
MDDKMTVALRIQPDGSEEPWGYGIKTRIWANDTVSSIVKKWLTPVVRGKSNDEGPGN